MAHGPYPATTASVGGVPNHVDIGLDAIFIVLFLAGAATHMTIFQLNKRINHKFIFSGMLFGFCIARTITNILRIAWATRPHNTRIALAAAIFYNAGTVLLYAINFVFTFRLVHSVRPFTGPCKALRVVRIAMIVVLILALIIVITTVIQSELTLNEHIHHVDRVCQLVAQTYLLAFASSPFLVNAWTVIAHRYNEPAEFGTGKWSTKALILVWSTALTVIVAGFRCGTSWETPRPRSDPAWYDKRWPFYVFCFVPELLCVYTFAIVRIDQRFYIPDNVKKGELKETKQADRSSSSLEVGRGGDTGMSSVK